jgi:hypothetical protein
MSAENPGDFLSCATELLALLGRLPDVADELNRIHVIYERAVVVGGRTSQNAASSRPVIPRTDKQPEKSGETWLDFKSVFESVAHRFLRYVALKHAESQVTPLDTLLARWDTINYQDAIRLSQDATAFVWARIRIPNGLAAQQDVLKDGNDGSDGPVPPKSLRFRGKLIDTIQPKPWALLNFLWKVTKAKVADVEQEVWGNEAEKSAMNRANEALLEVGAGKIVKKSGEWITLE